MKSITIKEDNTMVYEANIRKASANANGLVTTIPQDVVKLLQLDTDCKIKYTIVDKVSGGKDYEIELVRDE